MADCCVALPLCTATLTLSLSSIFCCKEQTVRSHLSSLCCWICFTQNNTVLYISTVLNLWLWELVLPCSRAGCSHCSALSWCERFHVRVVACVGLISVWNDLSVRCCEGGSQLGVWERPWPGMALGLRSELRSVPAGAARSVRGGQDCGLPGSTITLWCWRGGLFSNSWHGGGRWISKWITALGFLNSNGRLFQNTSRAEEISVVFSPAPHGDLPALQLGGGALCPAGGARAPLAPQPRWPPAGPCGTQLRVRSAGSRRGSLTRACLFVCVAVQQEPRRRPPGAEVWGKPRGAAPAQRPAPWKRPLCASPPRAQALHNLPIVCLGKATASYCNYLGKKIFDVFL